MRKIKFLHGFLIFLLLIFCLNIYNTFIIFKSFEGISNSDFIITIIFSVITIIGLFFLQRAFYFIIKKGIFNTSTISNFKKGGLFFLISGIGTTLFNTFMIFTDSDNTSHNFFFNFEKDFLLIMIGFGLFILADIIENGYIFKQENELTI